MPRPSGVRNHDFEDKRTYLIEGLTEFALRAELKRPSLRQFAIAVDASEPTLRHYFGDRKGVIKAIIAQLGKQALAGAALACDGAPDGPLAIQEARDVIGEALKDEQVLRGHAFGIIEGLADPEAGRAYLEFMLEPALQAVERQISERFGSLQTPAALRAASLALVSPILVMGLQQNLMRAMGDDAMECPDPSSQISAWLDLGISVQPG